MKHISSIHNPLIKQLLSLKEKSKERKKSGLFVIEGIRELSLAIQGGYRVEQFFFCPDILSENEMQAYLPSGLAQYLLVSVSKSVYERIAYRDSTEGALALMRAKEHTLQHLSFKSQHPLLLVAEAPEKPGNIGALLRTADAAGVDAVLIASPKTDLYNPNSIRSSLGAMFTLPIATGSVSEIIHFLQQRRIPFYCAALDASTPYYMVNFTQSAAIVVGAEDSGLSPLWLEAAVKNIIILMHGRVDSMNVSAAAAILIFEANRQRALQ